MMGKAIDVGAKLPEATLLWMGAEDAEAVVLSGRLKGRKVAIFGLPGAFTSTCSSAHVPSFIRSAKALADKGVEEIICVSVNDPFVMEAWGKATGAIPAGITMLGDADGSFTKAIGMELDASGNGLGIRSKRYSMLVEDGVVKKINLEPAPGKVEVSGGDTLLGQL